MGQVAAILDSLVLYRYSVILALSAAAGICLFMACCAHVRIPSLKAAASALLAVLLSLPLARLIYWYGRPDSFTSFTEVCTRCTTEDFALAGCFAGCLLAALFVARGGDRASVLDCMSVGGSFAIALGRLGCFFTAMDRGQIMVTLTGLPWAYPVANVSGQLEYRFATFLFQAAAAAAIGVFLTALFLQRKRPGDVAMLFVLTYSASQVLLDSTRYDSLYLRSNGFISLVQLLAAIALAVILVLFSIRAVKVRGRTKTMIIIWVALAALLGAAGYMEYYVQRHGREAAFSYSIMGICLTAIVLLGLILWNMTKPAEKNDI